MQLPGRLRATTLADLLTTLHAARARGTLELVEDRGRAHRVHVHDGMVVAVEVDGAATPLGDLLRRERAVEEDTLKRSVLRAMASHRLLGEVLVNDFRLAPTVVGAALRRQMLGRLELLERLEDAQIHFRVAVRTPRGALTGEPLGPTDLPRRRRAPSPERAAAMFLLGVEASADEGEIKRAYRRLARLYHPDLHPAATDGERRTLAERFTAVTEAYRTLVA